MKLQIYFNPLFSVYCPHNKKGRREVLHQSQFGVLVWEEWNVGSAPFIMCMAHEPEETFTLARNISTTPAPAGESEGAS